MLVFWLYKLHLCISGVLSLLERRAYGVPDFYARGAY